MLYVFVTSGWYSLGKQKGPVSAYSRLDLPNVCSKHQVHDALCLRFTFMVLKLCLCSNFLISPLFWASPVYVGVKLDVTFTVESRFVATQINGYFICMYQIFKSRLCRTLTKGCIHVLYATITSGK